MATPPKFNSPARSPLKTINGWKTILFPFRIAHFQSRTVTHPKTNIAPGNGWLEDDFSFWGGWPIFRGELLNFQALAVKKHSWNSYLPSSDAKETVSQKNNAVIIWVCSPQVSIYQCFPISYRKNAAFWGEALLKFAGAESLKVKKGFLISRFNRDEASQVACHNIPYAETSCVFWGFCVKWPLCVKYLLGLVVSCRFFQASTCIISPLTRTWSACALRFLDVNDVVGWGLDDGGLKAEALLLTSWKSSFSHHLYLKNSRWVLLLFGYGSNSYKKKWHENTSAPSLNLISTQLDLKPAGT